MAADTLLVRAFVTDHPIRPEELLELAARRGHGATNLFVGAVRDHHEGRAVRAVTYDCFRPLAEKVLGQIASEAASEHQALVAVAHRVGRLEVGEISVAIAASSPHRAQAFDASRAVIEQIKVRLPVWKKEHYVEGESAWLSGCALGAAR